MSSKPEFQSQILGSTVNWRYTEEDDEVDRWVAKIEFPKTTLDVNFLTPVHKPPAKYLKPVSKLIEKLHAEFQRNIDEIVNWYARTDGKYNERAFRRQLLIRHALATHPDWSQCRLALDTKI